MTTLAEFQQAIDAFPGPHGIQLDWSVGTRDRAERSLRQYGFCLLGEIHGVAENPLIIEQLVLDLSIQTVALEWARELELAVRDISRLSRDPPIAGEPPAPMSEQAPGIADAWSGDGRITAGHFAVLRRPAVSLLALEEPIYPGSLDERDAAIARDTES